MEHRSQKDADHVNSSRAAAEMYDDLRRRINALEGEPDFCEECATLCILGNALADLARSVNHDEITYFSVIAEVGAAVFMAEEERVGEKAETSTSLDMVRDLIKAAVEKGKKA